MARKVWFLRAPMDRRRWWAIAVVVVVLLSAGPAGAIPERPPDPPDPEPAPGTAWYGSLTRNIDLKFRDIDDDIKRTRVQDTVFSSQNGAEGWTAFFSDYVYESYLDNGTGWCYEDLAHPYEAPTYFSNVVEGTFSGSGHLTAVVGLDAQGAPRAFINTVGPSYEQTSTVEGMNACGDISTGTSTFGSGGIDASSAAQAACPSDFELATITVQSFAGSCTETTVEDHQGTATTTTVTTWTWDFRRAECDVTVDSDGDDLADCTEYALGTDPSNPDTDGDGLTDGQEVLTYGTDPLAPDTDGDGLTDGQEVLTHGTDPKDPKDPEDPEDPKDPEDPEDPEGPAFSWEALPRSQGTNGNLHYDDGKWSEPLPASRTLMTRFSGCHNGGTTQFTIDGIRMEPDCELTWPLEEGPHIVTVSVLGGPNEGTTTATINLVHHLVVGLGDSFGSGESQGGELEWEDSNCRRAGWSAQARAAVALEASSPHSTVTFLHLACSGATVNKGVLGPYPKPPGGNRVTRSQVQQAADLTSGYDIDAVLLSVGGNDIGFADVLSTCAAQRNCPLTKFRTDTKMNSTKTELPLHKESAEQLSRLVGKYSAVAGCLTGPGPCLATDWQGNGSLRVGATEATPTGDPNKVLITEYPDLGTRTGGRGMTSPEGYTYCKNALKGFSAGDGIQDEEFAWAREVVQRGVAGTEFTYRKDLVGRADKNVQVPVTSHGLNQVINAGPQGWTPVSGTFDAFGGHGYCAEDAAWVTTMKLHYIVDNKTAAFHPNKLGYKKWGTIIGNSLTLALAGQN